MPDKLSKINQSVEKTLKIIEVMADNPPLRLQEIAKALEMPASTVLRMVNTLVVRGYAHQDSQTQRYCLSLRFAKIGDQICSRLGIREIAHPKLVELSRRCGESCCLAIEENMEVVYTDVVEGPDSMLKIMQRIGKRAPMHCTGVGKLLLVYGTNELDDYVSAKGLSALTPATIVSREALAGELEQVWSQGYAMDNEECEIGARCIAAPVWDYTDNIAAAISVSGPASRMTDERMRSMVPIVIEAAAQISGLMGYTVK